MEMRPAMLQALKLPKKVYFKTGCMPVALRELGEIYHCSRALLITDSKLYDFGVCRPILDILHKKGIRVAEYFTIADPVRLSDIDGARHKLDEFKPDIIIGIGSDNAMSAAKALFAINESPGLDLVAASKDPDLIHPGIRSKLVLIATDFAFGTQNSPFAFISDEEGNSYTLKSINLIPEISVTDADFVATLSSDQIHESALELLSRAIRAYLDDNCCEFTSGLLLESIDIVMKHTADATHGNPLALERLHNAGALTGASYGNISDTIISGVPYFPNKTELSGAEANSRCADLAKQLGFTSCDAFLAACEALR